MFSVDNKGSEKIPKHTSTNALGSLTGIVSNYKSQCSNLSADLRGMKEKLQNSNFNKKELERQLQEKDIQLRKAEAEIKELKSLNRNLQHNVIQKMDSVSGENVHLISR